MICIPVSATTNAEMLDLIRLAAAEPAGMLELRLDGLKETPLVEELVAASPLPVIATCRSWREGGGHTGDDETRRDILRRAALAGATHIDAEAGDVERLQERGNALLIASFHDFDSTPPDLGAAIRRLCDLPADWVKFSVTARSPVDGFAVLDAIASCPKPCIGMAMGQMGLVTRILGPAYGSRVTFGSLATGRESAPGQPTARTLARRYRVNGLTRETAVYGLLGNPVAQSKGYILHNAAFERIGFDGVYIPFLTEDAEEFLAAAPATLNLRGLSVTIPHKAAALQWAGVVSEAARRIGAVNTLTLRPDGWHGDNTDCLAVVESIKAGIADADLAGARALVLGAGGTTGAVGVALTLLGCRVTVAARDGDKAARIAGRLNWKTVPWDNGPRGRWDVVANTTPVGMYPDSEDSPWPADAWKRGMVAFDAVHTPPMTRFLREAEAAGAVPISGEDMFIRQAAGQFRMWTGEEMPEVSDQI